MGIIGSVLWCFLIINYYSHSNVNGLTIGILFGDYPAQEQLLINNSISSKYENGEIIFSSNIRSISGIDSYTASETMCQMISDGSGVAAVFGPKHSISTTILEAISSEFQVPYILTSWKPPSAIESEYTLNFFPDASLFARGISDIVKSFGWKSFVVLYEDDIILEKLQHIFVLQKYNKNDRRNRIILEKLGPGSDYRRILEKIQTSSQTNVILDCRMENIIAILHQAKSVNMLNAFNNYFITNLDAYTLDYSELNTTANITTIKLIDDNNYEFLEDSMMKMGLGELIHHKKFKTDIMLFYDAFWFMNETLNELGPAIMTNPVFCNRKESSVSGKKLIEYMHKRVSTSHTLTGPISFDHHGNRISFNLFVVDVLHETNIATWSSHNSTLQVNRHFDEKLTAVSNLQGTKVIVSSRLGAPYLMLRQNEDDDISTGNARFEGYTLDLVAGIAKIVGFEFEVRLTEDQKYGSWDENNGKWNGIIGDILNKKAHLGVADLTITHERREVVDFSLPFMSLGIGILYKKQPRGNSRMFEFMSPFSDSVWTYTGYLIIFMSISLYFVMRLSSRDWRSSQLADKEEVIVENLWNIKNCIWMIFGSLTGQGCEIFPKGISARIAITTWWFFCMILMSCYIANLTAFTNLSTLDSSINNVEDLARQSRIKYGLLEGGSTESFFENSNYSTYQRMWSNMEQRRQENFVMSNYEGVEKVSESRNGLYAFLMESTQIEYVLETHCDLKQVGDWLDSKSYGIAMPLNAPYRTAVNGAILRMQESGQLADLKHKWWVQKQAERSCAAGREYNEKRGSYELTLMDIIGIFLVILFGIALALILTILTFLWDIRKISKKQKLPYCKILMEELKFATFIWSSKRRYRLQE
ncbi:unnamed protein product [Phaedon cochleariae]|uniref:Uncharacterized protein n=1 Tax=Phaedon cochleariae TaxID=80249 RepID=A0A9P0GVC3_PHACE|nr:unnamed protein product [Phaedon cochleariae]